MRTHAVVFTPRAERHLDELYRYIADASGEARADAYVGKIVAACRSLSLFPERGARRDDIRPNLRALRIERRVTVAFSLDLATTTVAIHGVFYGGRDFETLLRDTDGGE